MTTILKFAKIIRGVSRAFPYGRYLITIFPFFAILMNAGFITSFSSLLLIIPFITTMQAGFMFNTYCDAEKDPKEKNPITRGDISKKTVLSLVILWVIISNLLFILIFKSKMAIILFLIYNFFWFGYSGLKIRFKETVLGPIIASIVLFVGPPLILLSEFNYFNHAIMSLLIGLFIIYTAHEIKHTVIEHDIDLSYNCKTFAVILGKKLATIIEYIALIIGYLFLLGATLSLEDSPTVPLAFIIFFSIAVVSTVLYGYRVNFSLKKDLIFITLPYIATRVFIIIYGCLILNIPWLLIIFILWILFTDKYL